MHLIGAPAVQKNFRRKQNRFRSEQTLFSSSEGSSEGSPSERPICSSILLIPPILRILIVPPEIRARNNAANDLRATHKTKQVGDRDVKQRSFYADFKCLLFVVFARPQNLQSARSPRSCSE